MRRAARGSVLIESVMLMPFLFALLIGTVELARIIYTYYMLEKVMYSLAQYLGSASGVNFCDNQDPSVQAAINYAISGDPSSAENPVVAGLTPGMFQVQIERYNAATQQLIPCDCSTSGCDASQGGLPPGYVVVSLTDGYTVHPALWARSVAAFPLRPTVRAPYGGT